MTLSYGLLETTVTDERGRETLTRSDNTGLTQEQVRFHNGQTLTTKTTFDLLVADVKGSWPSRGRSGRSTSRAVVIGTRMAREAGRFFSDN